MIIAFLTFNYEYASIFEGMKWYRLSRDRYLG